MAELTPRQKTMELLRERCETCGHPTKFLKADMSVHPTHTDEGCIFKSCECKEAHE